MTKIFSLQQNIARLACGWSLIALNAYILWNVDHWPTPLITWIFLTIVADECSFWFGYLGLLLGGIPLLSTTSVQWPALIPLVGGALWALLIVKHAGKIEVLPFAALVFFAPLWAAQHLGPHLDPGFTLPSSRVFVHSALYAMLAGILVSSACYLVTLYQRWRSQSAPAL